MPAEPTANAGRVTAPPPGSPRRFWSVGARLAAGFLFLVLLIFLWGFQILRSLHYDIVRASATWSCASALPSSGRLRVFSALPPENRATADPARARPATFHIWAHHLPPARPGKPESYVMRIGARTFTISARSDSRGRPVWRASGGAEPGARFAYFVFLAGTNLTKDWAQGESLPNFIILNWADLRGYLLHSFTLADFVLALAGALLLVAFIRYWRLHFRALLPPPRRRPDARWFVRHGGWAAVIFLLYWIPLFHNIVLLYFAGVALGLQAARSLWRQNPHARPWNPKTVTILLMIGAAAFALRAFKADWGFPLQLYTDENAITSFPPRMAARNSLDPIDFERPNHGSIYLNSILYGLASRLRFHRPLQDTFADHVLFYHWLSRLAVAVLGVWLVWVAYLVGAEFHRGFGLWAALLFTLFPQFVQYSHYVTPDISMTLALLGTVLFALRYQRAPTTANLLYACACAAGATAEKYPGVLALSALLAAAAWAHARDGKRLLLVAVRAASAYLGFLFLFAPYLFLHPHLVLLNLISESRPTHAGQDGLGLWGNLLYYVHTYADSTSLLLAAFALVGGVALVRQWRRSFPLLVGLVYWILLSDLPLHWDRWDIPMVVTPLLLAAYGMHCLWELGGRSAPAPGRLTRAAVAVLALAACVDLGLKDAVLLADFASPDTRWIGVAKLDSLGVNRENALSDQYTPLNPIWKNGFDFIAAYHDSTATQDRKYAVVSSDFYGRFFRQPEKYSAEVNFYRTLFRAPEVLDLKPNPMPERFASFNDFANLRRAAPAWRDYTAQHAEFSVGPEIRVFRIAAAPQ